MPEDRSQHSTLMEEARERHFGQEPSHRDVPPNWCPICGLFEQLEAANKALETPRQYDVLLSDLQEQQEALNAENARLNTENRGLLEKWSKRGAERDTYRVALELIRDKRDENGSLITGREAEAIAFAALSDGAGLADPSDLSRAPVAGVSPSVSYPASTPDAPKEGTDA